MNHWIYNEQKFEEKDIPEEAIGFIYCITEINSGKKYIGKKLFWKTVKRKPRGTKRVKRVKVASDWQDYYGSSENLKARLEYHGEMNYHREILHIANSKGMLSYLEAKEQFDRGVLLSDEYYNGIINCRINEKHLK